MSDDFDMGGDMSSDFDTDISFDTSDFDVDTDTDFDVSDIEEDIDFDTSDCGMDSEVDASDIAEDVEAELSDEVMEEMSSEFEEEFENDIPEDIIEEDFVEENAEDILNQKIDDIVNNENLSTEAKTELLNDIKDSAVGAMSEEAAEIPEDVEELAEVSENVDEELTEIPEDTEENLVEIPEDTEETDGEAVKVLQMGDSDTTVVHEDTEQKLEDLEEGYQNAYEMEENIFEHILEDESLSEEDRIESLQNLREDAQGLSDQYYSDVAEVTGDESGTLEYSGDTGEYTENVELDIEQFEESCESDEAEDNYESDENASEFENDLDAEFEDDLGNEYEEALEQVFDVQSEIDVADLNDAEKISLMRYTGDGYSDINKSLYDPEFQADSLEQEMRIQSDVDHITGCLDRKEIPCDTKIYRGVSDMSVMFGTDAVTMSVEELNEKYSGMYFKNEGFSSTATNEAVASRFVGRDGGIMEIDAPKGTKGMCLGEVSLYEDREKEVLLQRDTIYQINSVKMKNNQIHIVTTAIQYR